MTELAAPLVQARPRKGLRRLGIALLVLAVAATAVTLKLRAIQRDAVRLAETGQSTIRMLNAYASAVKARDPGQLAALYDDGYQAAAQAHWTRRLESERDGVRVFTWENESPRRADKAEIVGQLGSYLASLGNGEEVKFKLARVESSAAESAVVRAVLWVRAANPDGQSHESHAAFRLHLAAAGKSGWKITGQELLHGETVEGPRAGFTDVTQSAGVDFAARHNPAWSTPEWRPTMYEIVRYASAGISAADYDGDGWDDLFFGDGAAARLYRNQGDGTFRDATAEAGLPTDLSAADVAIFADFDNDGDEDLFVGRSTAGNLLFRNDGGGHFTDVTAEAGPIGGTMVTVAAAADYDHDGLLDLYVGRYLDPRTRNPTTLFYTRNGEGNILLHNLGGLRFEDVTERSGTREGGLALGVGWGDFDGDGWEDIYVSNDFGRNALLHNNGDGTFTDRTAETGSLSFGYNMSVHVGDIDNDGDLDIYTSGVHSGQRWYAQAPSLANYLITSAKQGTLREDFPSYRQIYHYVGAEWHRYGDGMVKGNSLLLNDGHGNFREVAEAASANPFGWYWGSGMADLDNDGRQDVYAANGWITGHIPDDL